MGVPWEAKKNKTKQKLLLFGNEAYHDQHGIVVVAGQPADKWAFREGHP